MSYFLPLYTCFILALDMHVSSCYDKNYNVAIFSHVPIVNMFGREVGMWQVLAVVTFPISMLKQVVSVIQLIVACKNLGALDVVARSRALAGH